MAGSCLLRARSLACPLPGRPSINVVLQEYLCPVMLSWVRSVSQPGRWEKEGKEPAWPCWALGVKENQCLPYKAQRCESSSYPPSPAWSPQDLPLGSGS